MSSHFNWLYLFSFLNPDRHHVVYMLVTGGVFLFLALLARRTLKNHSHSLTPDGHFSLKAGMESLIALISRLSHLVVGEGGRPFVPFFCTLFLFVWVSNLMGLIPGMSAATSNLNTTLALGGVSFLVYNIYGFKEHGMAYLKQFMGPVLLLAPLLFVIELVSHLVRPFSLGLRLYGNMLGDHTVLSIFLDLVPLFVPVVFYFLGFFVCTMQAFIFTILSMVYVSVALSHDH